MAGPRTRSQTTSNPRFPKGFDTASITKLKVADLKTKITKLKSVHADGANKSELQATYVMALMGVNKDDVKRLLKTVSAWCGGKVAEVHEEMEDRGLDIRGNRWACIETLVGDELGREDSDDEEASDHAEPPPKKKAKVTLKTTTSKAKVANKPKDAAKTKGKKVVVEEKSEEEELPRKNAKAASTKAKDTGKGKKNAKKVVEQFVDEPESEEQEGPHKNVKAPSPKVMGTERGKEKEVEHEEGESPPKTKGKGKGKEITSEDPQAESSKTPKGKGKGKELAAEADKTEEVPAKRPAPEVLNLLIGSIFADLAKPETNLQAVYPDCPFKTKGEIVKVMNALPAFQTEEQIPKLFDDPESEAAKLVLWIIETFGDEIFLAEGDLKIPGWSAQTAQFVIAKPRDHLQKAWKQAFAEDKEKSTLIFHGSGYVNLQSFLRRGFLSLVGGGLYAGESPIVSNGYASTMRKPYLHSSTGVNVVGTPQPALYGGLWNHDPYRTTRLMFGCEATGTGRLISPGEGGFHVITRMHSVMARYIFLLGSSGGIPTRAMVGPTMTAAFETIRAGIEEGDKA